MNKPKFDPSKPFAVAMESKPPFDPSKPFQSDSSIGIIEEGPSRTAQTVSAFARPALEVGGAVGGAVLAGGASAPTIAGIIPAGVAGGALGFAAGKSAADFLDEQLGIKEPITTVKEAVKATGRNILSGIEQEALGALAKPAFNIARNVARSGAKKAISSFFGPSEEAISARFNRPEEIKNAKPLEDIAKNMSSAMGKLSDEVSRLDKEAWDSLLKLKSEPRSEIINILKGVKKGIQVEGGGTIGKAAAKATETINGLMSDILKITEKGKEGVEQFLTQKQIRKVIQAVDENIDWNNPLASRSNEALTEFRAKLSDRLKANNPQYSAIMEPLAQRTKALNDLSRAFSLGHEAGVFVPKDTTTGRLSLAVKEGRSSSRGLLSKLKEYTGEDVLKNVKDEMLASEFRGGRPNGSRTVNMFSGILGGLGGGAGAFAGGVPGAFGGGAFGTVAGNILGGIVDRRGGQIAGSIVDRLARLPLQQTKSMLLSPSFRRVLSSAGVGYAE